MEQTLTANVMEPPGESSSDEDKPFECLVCLQDVRCQQGECTQVQSRLSALQLVRYCDCCCLPLAVPLQMLLTVCCCYRSYLAVQMRAQLLRRVLRAAWRCSGSVPDLQKPAGGLETQGV